MSLQRRKASTKNGIPIAYVANGQEVRGENVSEILKNAGLDFEIKTDLLHDPHGKPIFGKNIFNTRVYRADTNQTLGTVTPKYRVLQNQEVLNVLDELVNMGYGKFDRIGERNGGQEMWVSMELDTERNTIGGVDWVDQFIYARNGNDGNGALKFTPMNIRPSCTNQYSFISSQIKNAGIDLKKLTVRHSSKMDDRIKQAVEALNIVNTMNENFIGVAEQMLEVSLEIGDREKFYADALGLATDEKLVDKNNKLGLKTRGMNTVNKLFELETHDNNSNIMDTAWGTFNTLTQYIDHEYIKNADGSIRASSVDSAMFGSASRMKSNAFDLLHARIVA
jgi:phage/plasmid-like protein (TIGR03299 family)